MAQPTLSDVYLFVADLVSNEPPQEGQPSRRQLLAMTWLAQTYLPAFDQQYMQISALPTALQHGEPLADELTGGDTDHDGYGAAIYYLTEAYRLLPGLSESLRQAAIRIQQTFVPELAVLKLPYADEAAQAETVRKAAQSQAVDLVHFPVLQGEGQPASLDAWVASFAASKQHIADLLSQRAAIKAGLKDRTAALQLRNTSMGLISRCRAALADELRTRPELPQDLDARIFGYLDELALKRERAKAQKAAAAAAAPVAVPAAPAATPPSAPATPAAAPAAPAENKAV